jgi:hypothetical protein
MEVQIMFSAKLKGRGPVTDAETTGSVAKNMI